MIEIRGALHSDTRPAQGALKPAPSSPGHFLQSPPPALPDDKRVLQMIDAMASFGGDRDGGMMSTSMNDPKVAKLLTALPQLHHAQVP